MHSKLKPYSTENQRWTNDKLSCEKSRQKDAFHVDDVLSYSRCIPVQSKKRMIEQMIVQTHGANDYGIRSGENN